MPNVKPLMTRPALPALLVAAAVLSGCAPAQHAPPATSGDTAQAPAAPPKPKITAEQLLGQTDSWLLDKMGEPAFRRTDRHANMWQYKNGSCVLNVFLYADGEKAKSARVLHFDARTLDGGNTDRAQCLSVLQD